MYIILKLGSNFFVTIYLIMVTVSLNVQTKNDLRPFSYNQAKGGQKVT